MSTQSNPTGIPSNPVPAASVTPRPVVAPQISSQSAVSPSATNHNSVTRGAQAAFLHPFNEADSTDLTEDEIRLANIKLGLVNGLFTALRAKHTPTAAHSFRVGVGLSHWGLSIGMPEPDLELIELVGLLHDIGKLSVPDRILQKPRRLTSDEQSVIDMHPHVGVKILAAAGASEPLQQIVSNIGSAYGRLNQQNCSSIVRLSSQMLAIFDAFDSMTTDQVYRPALSRERALSELFKNSGAQFNPKLVRSFADSMMRSSTDHDQRVRQRWMSQLNSTANSHFHLEQPVWSDGRPRSENNDSRNQTQLLDNMREAYICIDIGGGIKEWNYAAECITGLSRSTTLGREWTPSMIGLLNEVGYPVSDERCPLATVQSSGMHENYRFSIQHRDGNLSQVGAKVFPIVGDQRNIVGSAMLLRDESDQVSLEQTVHSLNEKVTQDELTQVNNRAELNRQLPLFVSSHLEKAQAGSLIICDIDHFKKINDTYGHPAGDDALVVFASILKQMSRESDIVARYGGEEFVILCPGCDVALACEKAEAIRAELSIRPLPSLRSTCITASFGVTEVQPGDTAETFLARADRALLDAKERGRNRVVEIGGGQSLDDDIANDSNGWLKWFGIGKTQAILENNLITAVPKDIAIEKLKGFIADHSAEVITAEDAKVVIRIDSRNSNVKQRAGDRPASFFLNIALREVVFRPTPEASSTQLRTLIQLQVRPVRERDRRTSSLSSQAENLRHSFQSYLGAQRVNSEMRENLFDAMTRQPID